MIHYVKTLPDFFQATSTATSHLKYGLMTEIIRLVTHCVSMNGMKGAIQDVLANVKYLTSCVILQDWQRVMLRLGLSNQI